MPNGTATAPPRMIAMHEARHARCPTCEIRLRMTVGEGVALVTCFAHQPGSAIACGQKLVIVGLVGQISIVIPITRAEFDALNAADVLAGPMLEALGVLNVRLMAVS